MDKVRLGRTAVLSDLGHGISPVYYFKGVVMLSSEAGFSPNRGCCWRCERRRISHGLSPSQLRTDPARLSLLHRMGVLRRVSQNSPSNPCPPTLERRLWNWGTPPNPRREAYRTSFETASASQTAVPWSECEEPPDRAMPWTRFLWRTSWRFEGLQRWDVCPGSSSSLQTRHRKPCGPLSRRAGSPALGAPGSHSSQEG